MLSRSRRVLNLRVQYFLDVLTSLEELCTTYHRSGHISNLLSETHQDRIDRHIRIRASSAIDNRSLLGDGLSRSIEAACIEIADRLRRGVRAVAQMVDLVDVSRALDCSSAAVDDDTEDSKRGQSLLENRHCDVDCFGI